MGLRIGNEPVPGYKLVRFLGRGGFGQVWAASSPGGVLVAMKIIDLGGREGAREFKALRLMKLIRHPNLTPLLAFWFKDENGNLVDESQVDNQLPGAAPQVALPQNLRGTIDVSLSKLTPDELIIAMGLGDKTLYDRLQECKAEGFAGIPLDELFNYMKDAARAIDFLNTPRHDLGHGPVSPIQHCDIKPQNILIVGDAAQVCDFGLARELGANVKMTSAAVSPAYGAPELLSGQPPSGGTDQYSLAIAYVELRTGGLPFTDPDSYLHVVNAHLYGNLELSGLTPAEQDVIRKATSREPGDRYESATKMVRALQHACPDDSDSIRAPAHRPPATGSQTDSGLDMTMPLPRGGPGQSTVPHPPKTTAGSGLTETPGPRVGVTKVDSRATPGIRGSGSMAATTMQPGQYAESEQAEPQGTKRKIGWKLPAVAAVVAAVLAVGGFVYSLLPTEKDTVLAQASGWIAEAQEEDGNAEPDLLKQARLYLQAIQACKALPADSELSGQILAAEGGLKPVLLRLRNKSTTLGDSSNGKDPTIAAMIAGYRKLEADFSEFYDLRLVHEARVLLAISSAEALVKTGEMAITQPGAAEGSLKAARDDFQRALALFADEPGTFKVDEIDQLRFRSGLGAAKIGVLLKVKPSAAAVSNLDGELRELAQSGSISSSLERLWQQQVRLLMALSAEAEQEPSKAVQSLVDVDTSNFASRADEEQFSQLLTWLKKPEIIARLTPEERGWVEDQSNQGANQALKQIKGKLKAVLDLLPGNNAKAIDSALVELKTAREKTERSIGVDDRSAIDQLIVLVDPSTDESAFKKSIDWFAAVPSDESAKWDRDIRQAFVPALVNVAQRQKQFTPQVIEVLRQKFPGDNIATGELQKLLAQRLDRLVFEPYAADVESSEVYFKQLGEVAGAIADTSDAYKLSRLAAAESLHASSPDPRTEEAKFAKLLDEAAMAQDTDPGKLANYEKFVTLLVRPVSFKLSDADQKDLSSLVSASMDNGAPGFTDPPRREELAQLLIRAAASTRRPMGDRPGIDAIAQPYADGATGAKQSLHYLESAKQLKREMMLNTAYQANGLLAGWYVSEGGRNSIINNQAARLRELAADTSLPLGDRLPLLYLRIQLPAQPGDATDRAGLVNALIVLTEAINRADPTDDEQWTSKIHAIIEQTGKLLDEFKQEKPADPALRKQVAQLAYVNELARAKYPEAAKKVAGAFENYSLAVEFDGTNPDYVAARGFAALNLEPPNYNVAEQDAERLKEIAPKTAPAAGLLAYIKLKRARRATDPAEKESLARAAVEAGEDAVKAAKDDSARATYLLHLGDSYVAWANHGSTNSKEQAAKLNAAVKHIREALNIEGLAYRDYAHATLGNAHEDLAWLAKENIDANYDAAIAAFNDVIHGSPDLGNMSLGRCYYKREVDSNQTGKGYLDKAEKALQAAIEVNGEYSDAYRWLGAIEEAKKKYKEAAAYYKTSADLARKHGSYNYAPFIRHWARAAVEAREAPESVRAELTKLLSDEELKTDVARKDLNLRIAMTYEQQEKFKEAVDQYTAEIGADLKNATRNDVELLRGRAIASSAWATRLSDPKQSVALIRTAATDLDRMVALLGDDANWIDLHQDAQMNRFLWAATNSDPGAFPQVALKKSIQNFDAALTKMRNLLEPIVRSDDAKAQKLFYDYISLLATTVDKFVPSLGADSRKLVKNAPKQLRAAAVKVSPTFKSRIDNDKNLLKPELLAKIEKLSDQ